MDKIVEIDSLEPHFTEEVICVKCNYRYIATWNCKVWMKDLYCPSCNEQGGIIGTGQITFPHKHMDNNDEIV